MESIIAFPADLIGPLSEFYLFYDGFAHKECLNTWDKNGEFVKEWNNAILSESPINKSVLLSISSDGAVFFKKRPKY
jgi:hypothetical protein